MSLINTVETETSWNIVSILLYNQNAEELLKREYVNSDLELSTELISNFIQTIDTFAKHQFKEKLNEIYIGKYRILFQEINSFILVAIVKPGSKVNTGKYSLMNETVRTTLSAIGEYLELSTSDLVYLNNLDLKNLDDIVSKANAENPIEKAIKASLSNKSNHSKISDDAQDNFYVTSVIITDQSGRPFASRSYEEGVYTEDPLLLTSLLSAINSFAAQITQLEFKEIVLDTYRLYISNKAGRITVTTIELLDKHISLNHDSLISKKIRELNQHLIQSTDFLTQEGMSSTLSVNHHTVTAIVDSIVIKSLQNTLGKNRIDRTKVKKVNVFDQKTIVSEESNSNNIRNQLSNIFKRS